MLVCGRTKRLFWLCAWTERASDWWELQWHWLATGWCLYWGCWTNSLKNIHFLSLHPPPHPAPPNIFTPLTWIKNSPETSGVKYVFHSRPSGSSGSLRTCCPFSYPTKIAAANVRLLLTIYVFASSNYSFESHCVRNPPTPHQTYPVKAAFCWCSCQVLAQRNNTVRCGPTLM